MLKGYMRLILVLLVSINIAYAAQISEYKINFELVDPSSTVVNVMMIFGNDTTNILEYHLPSDYKDFSMTINEKSVLLAITNGVLKVGGNKGDVVEFKYTTKEFRDNDNFLVSQQYHHTIDKLSINLYLNEDLRLKKPIRNDDISSSSVFPKPTSVSSDGVNLILTWDAENIEPNDEISIFAQLTSKKLPVIIPILAFVLTSSIVLLTVLLMKKPKERIIHHKEDMVEEHLKEDEQEVIRVLKLKEGSCDQATLRIATGFPKATLSRLLSELEERKIIHKEKQGKKNKVFLKKGHWNNLEQ